MKIKRSQLKRLIENFLREEEDIEQPQGFTPVEDMISRDDSKRKSQTSQAYGKDGEDIVDKEEKERLEELLDDLRREVASGIVSDLRKPHVDKDKIFDRAGAPVHEEEGYDVYFAVPSTMALAELMIKLEKYKIDLDLGDDTVAAKELADELKEFNVKEVELDPLVRAELSYHDGDRDLVRWINKKPESFPALKKAAATYKSAMMRTAKRIVDQGVRGEPFTAEEVGAKLGLMKDSG